MTKEEFEKMKAELEAEYLATFKVSELNFINLINLIYLITEIKMSLFFFGLPYSIFRLISLDSEVSI